MTFFVIGGSADVKDNHVITGNDFVDEFFLVDLVDVLGHFPEIGVGGVEDRVVSNSRVAFVAQPLGWLEAMPMPPLRETAS